MKVIDFIADDLPDLLKQLDGREINGKTLTHGERHGRGNPDERVRRIFPSCSGGRK